MTLVAILLTSQVDEFADIPAPAQVDDFSAYSNNNFGTQDPGLDDI